ncbi:GntR family transcriptional regulator [Starkeya sp. ORNL1]|uniref:GntR family transcriptional regulator n=1 Tax=Starkeya sp. ORNL1 TaxID=2709380 RepID=UPI0014647D84|nr:GntR family transcriptional regulator [Starkeya sp. ORNL1]QJP14136.1 GntR family transcriptional regulator [Starkeya sp. ORNL1]
MTLGNDQLELSEAVPSVEDDTLSSVAMAKIIGLIRGGELLPGDIVNETDLAKQFGISRGPVREAVRQLQGRKLITREPYQRARVVRLDFAQIREIYELRECLEGMACRLATLKMSDAALAELMAAVELAKGPDNYSLVDTDYPFNFHEAIVNACGNSKIRQSLSGELYDLIRLYRWSTHIRVPEGRAHSRDHWQICRAMQARDADLAESLMRGHIRRVAALIENTG